MSRPYRGRHARPLPTHTDRETVRREASELVSRPYYRGRHES